MAAGSTQVKICEIYLVDSYLIAHVADQSPGAVRRTRVPRWRSHIQSLSLSLRPLGLGMPPSRCALSFPLFFPRTSRLWLRVGGGKVPKVLPEQPPSQPPQHPPPWVLVRSTSGL